MGPDRGADRGPANWADQRQRPPFLIVAVGANRRQRCADLGSDPVAKKPSLDRINVPVDDKRAIVPRALTKERGEAVR
jgi:hypothetical protein